MRPKSLEDLIVKLNALPGITKKQAERLAYNIVSKHKEEAIEVASSIVKAIENIHPCQTCGHLTDEAICSICTDKNRVRILVVVESPLDVFKFEDTQSIKPYYHVLNGLINVSEKVDFEDLNIGTLKERSGNFSEIILALSPNLEGIVTANYIRSLLKDKKVTQLAQGIPLGAAMEYVDELTLKAALDNRKEVK